MLTSRGLILRRVLTELSRTAPRNVTKQIQPVRNSAIWSYRTGCPPHSKATRYGAELAGALMWWWVLWHLWHDYDHITGEFEYPDTSKWTDEELGIPPE